MEPVHYLRALRQWWFLIVGLALVGLIAAVATYSPPTKSYTATHTLAQVVGDGGTNPINLNRAAFLTTAGAVPRAVADELGTTVDGVTDGVSAFADSDLGGVQIESVASQAGLAQQRADTFAEQLVKVLTEQANGDYQKSLADATKAVADAGAALSASGINPPAPVKDRYDDAVKALEDLQSSGAPTPEFQTIGATEVTETSSGTGRNTRAAVGAFVGLLLGVIIALMLSRFDTRIRSRESAEEAFGAPVLAEIPTLRRKQRRKHTMVVSSDPESLGAEAYRSVRTALVVAGHARLQRESARRRRRGSERPRFGASATRVVMVVSPGMGEGKTTTSANLAAAFAETGQTVLLMGLDLRRPELHNFLGVNESPGLTDALADPTMSLHEIVQDTSVPGVRMIPSGQPIEQPGELLTRGLDKLETARTLADIVLIDTAPLLATDDASVLIPLVDDVVLVCRAGRTPLDTGVRTRELLTRLEAPIAGVVLIGSQQVSSARSYYRSEYRSRTRPAPKAAAKVAATSEDVEAASPTAPTSGDPTPNASSTAPHAPSPGSSAPSPGPSADPLAAHDAETGGL